jgi:hypothetical protein
MKEFLFMKPVLQFISEGKFFRKTVAVALRILAITIAFASLVGWIVKWQFVFSLPVTGIIGGIIFQLLMAVAVYMVIHIALIRAGNIERLPEAEYTVIPIVALCLKLLGEIYASFLAVTAIAGGLYIWMTNRNVGKDLLGVVAQMVPTISDLSFIGGVKFILSGATMAFISLLVSYFLSEMVIVMVDIARNTRFGNKG